MAKTDAERSQEYRDRLKVKPKEGEGRIPWETNPDLTAKYGEGEIFCRDCGWRHLTWSGCCGDQAKVGDGP